MMSEGAPTFTAALQKDLHKSAWEAMFTEFASVMLEIQHALADVEKWMAPTEVDSGMFNAGAVSQIYHDSLGVVLIIGAWNYPVHLTLMPLVGAIAAGNCCCIKA